MNAPAVGTITWSCPRPSEVLPMPLPGSSAWWEQHGVDIMNNRTSMTEWLMRAEATLQINPPHRWK